MSDYEPHRDGLEIMLDQLGTLLAIVCVIAAILAPPVAVLALYLGWL